MTCVTLVPKVKDTTHTACLLSLHLYDANQGEAHGSRGQTRGLAISWGGGGGGVGSVWGEVELFGGKLSLRSPLDETLPISYCHVSF